MVLRLAFLVLVACSACLAQRRGGDYGDYFSRDPYGRDKPKHTYTFSQVDLNGLRSVDNSFASKPTVFSPLGLRTALAILHAGADVQTARTLKDGFVDDCGIKKVASSLASGKAHFSSIAFLTKDLDIKPGFKNTLVDTFNGDFEYADFSKPSKAAYNLDEWVRSTTEREFTTNSSEKIRSDARFAMANVAQLKTKWQTRFENAVNGVFYENGATPKMALIMKQTSRLRTGNVDSLEAQVLEIPLATPYKHAMYVVLPHKVDGFKNMMDKLNKNSLADIMNSLDRQERVEVYLPRFKVEADSRLPALYNASSGFQFEGIATQKVSARRTIFLKSALEVAEDGNGGSSNDRDFYEMRQQQPPVIFNASHPFLYIVTQMESISQNCNSKNLETFLMGTVKGPGGTEPLPMNWGKVGPKAAYQKPPAPTGGYNRYDPYRRHRGYPDY